VLGYLPSVEMFYDDIRFGGKLDLEERNVDVTILIYSLTPFLPLLLPIHSICSTTEGRPGTPVQCSQCAAAFL